MCAVYPCRSQSPALVQFGGHLTRWGVRGGFWLTFSLADCHLFCGITYLGLADEVDVSEPDNSVSE